jgi:FkbM family methyltransferase
MLFRELVVALMPPLIAAGGRRLLALRKPAAPERVKFPYGPYVLACDSTHHLPTILTDLPNYGRNVADVVCALDVAEPRVIDIGANIGDTAVLLARFAPGCSVLCVEGDSRYMDDLTENVAQVRGVTIAQTFLGDHTGPARGDVVAAHGTGHITLGGEHVMQLRTLDDLLSDHPAFARPDVIKIDTDGFDPAIMRGARRTLSTAKPVVFYEWHPTLYEIAGENDTSHAEFLMSLGYTGFSFFTNKGELLIHLRNPTRELLLGLASYSRVRRERNNEDWFFDIAAFPAERSDAWERLWNQYSKIEHARFDAAAVREDH